MWVGGGGHAIAVTSTYQHDIRLHPRGNHVMVWLLLMVDTRFTSGKKHAECIHKHPIIE